jgi:hypothetical protein
MNGNEILTLLLENNIIDYNDFIHILSKNIITDICYYLIDSNQNTIYDNYNSINLKTYMKTFSEININNIFTLISINVDKNIEQQFYHVYIHDFTRLYNHLYEYEKIIELAVQIRGLLLYDMPENIRNNKKIVKLAVQQNGHALDCVSDELKDDKEIVLLAIQQNGDAIQYVSDNLINEELILLAIENGGTIENISDEFRDNINIIKKAVIKNGLELEFASDRLKNNKEIAILALLSRKYAKHYISDELKSDIDIINLLNKLF